MTTTAKQRRSAFAGAKHKGSSKQRINVFGLLALMLVMKKGLLMVELASSKATEADSADDDEVTNRPTGVKAAKTRSKKTMVDRKELSEFQTMWSIKKQDLTLEERMSKMKVTSERVKEWKNHGLAVLMCSHSRACCPHV
ncbi:hypothetical protein F2Q69_00026740 [Brassica cretica]|uniref:No apical meristem-associated C-terminal domain-containing protein n=1 Tax=Brassica cretica TaxID=69181 RepID=A0A8S9S105_BRACR|nr:hypothetical protein F2Q69_00026740 [Brassica cretica]